MQAGAAPMAAIAHPEEWRKQSNARYSRARSLLITTVAGAGARCSAAQGLGFERPILAIWGLHPDLLA